MLMIKDQARSSALRALGARLAIARNEAGLTQSAMAKTAKVSFRVYLTYESGQEALPVDVLNVLYQRCGLDLEWIVAGSSPEQAQAIREDASCQPFIAALEDYLNRNGMMLHQESKDALLCRWHRSLQNGDGKSIEDAYTWAELLQE